MALGYAAVASRPHSIRTQANIQLAPSLDSGFLVLSGADVPALDQARRAAASCDAPSAQDAAAATTEQQALAAADTASTLQGGNKQDGAAASTSTGQSSKNVLAQPQPQLVTSGVAVADHKKQVHGALPAQQPIKKKSNQPRKHLQGSQELTAANDSVGRFAGFQS